MTSPLPVSSHDTATWFEQSGFGIRFGWGPNDLRRLAPAADVVVIIDVLSFSTAVDVALGRGAIVLPYARHDGTEGEFATANGAVVASQRRTTAAASDPGGVAIVDTSWASDALSAPQPTGGPSTTRSADAPSTSDRRSMTAPTDALSASEQTGEADNAPSGWSLSPASLTTIGAGTRLVLPSPNGSALAFGAKDAGAGEVLVACLRNASATARACVDADVVAVIAAGERWRGATGPLRPALEDLLGAGAVIDAITTLRSGHEANGNGNGNGERPGTAPSTGDRSPSPEASAAAAAFRDARADLSLRLAACGSGRELIDRGFGADVDLAAALDVSTVVAVLDGHELRPKQSSDWRRKTSP